MENSVNSADTTPTFQAPPPPHGTIRDQPNNEKVPTHDDDQKEEDDCNQPVSSTNESTEMQSLKNTENFINQENCQSTQLSG